jgi:hypothetical protein
MSDPAFVVDTIKRLAEEAKNEWDALDAADRGSITWLLQDFGMLLGRLGQGEDVTEKLRRNKAAMSQWAWVGAEKFRKIILEQLAKLAGEFGARLLAAAAF